MTGPRLHPTDEILAAYAGGGLRAGFDLPIAAHLEACAECRSRVRLFERAAGALLDEAEPAEMAPDSLAHLFARLERPAEAPALAARDRRPLAQRLPVGPRRWLGPGIWVQPVQVPHASEDRVYFLRVGAGIQGLHHSHAGPEFTQVVSGALRDGDTIVRAGDFTERGPEHTHHPVVLPDDGGCLCLVATQGRLQAKDWLGRLIQAVARV